MTTFRLLLIDPVVAVLAEAAVADITLRGQRPSEECGNALMDILEAIEAAPEPVERRRCVTHDAEHWDRVEGVGDLCYEAGWDRSDDYDPKPCRFVTVFEVPASPSDPTSETTT